MTPGRSTRTTVGGIVGLLAGLIALGPALKPGYLLWYDMVFVPRLAFSSRTLGVDGSVPRAVPNDLVVALASHVFPGWVVQKGIVLGTFVVVGAGVGALSRSRFGAAASALVAAWNPWLAERLAIGHWGFTAGYAVLPWVLVAALAARRGDRSGRAFLAFTLVLIALTGSTAAVSAVAIVLGALLLPRPAERWAKTLGWAGLVALLANAAWWFPYLVLAPIDRADPAGVAAFAARADTPFGVLGSVVTGGGIWNRGTWFPERQSAAVAGVALVAVLAVLVLAGRERARLTWWWPALGSGALGLLLGVLSALPGGDALVTWIVVQVPGGGLLRDSQKFVALWVIFLALASGAAVEVVRRVVRHRSSDGAAALLVASVVAVWPVATLPSLMGGAFGRWAVSEYPRSVMEAAHMIESGGGDVAVFPWSLYRRYSWNGDRVVLDPWQRLVRQRVLVNDDLPLSDRVVRGESADAARIRAANAAGEDLTGLLRELGVRWVVLETDQPSGGLPAPRVDASEVLRAPGISVLDLGDDPSPARRGVETPRAKDMGVWRFGGLAGLFVAVLVVIGYSCLNLRRPRVAPTSRVEEHHARQADAPPSGRKDV